MLEEYHEKFIQNSSIHTEFMKGVLLCNDSPLKEESSDRTTIFKKAAQIEGTSNSLSHNIYLVEQEFVGYII